MKRILQQLGFCVAAILSLACCVVVLALLPVWLLLGGLMLVIREVAMAWERRQLMKWAKAQCLIK